jgi:metal transporter CNNM
MNTLIFLILIIFLLICLAIFSGLAIGVLTLNRFDLKLKALRGNKQAKIIYPYRLMGYQLPLTLLFGIVFAIAGVMALLDTKMLGLFAVFLTTIIVVIPALVLPMTYVKISGINLTAKFVPLLKYLLIMFSPVARPLGRMLDDKFGEYSPRVHSKEELYKILDEHKVSDYSDLDKEEIRIVRHALSFGNKQVREVMIPRRSVVSVSADEVIGPIVIDELHKSGHSRFPVTADKKSQNFIGTLYLRDLVGLNKTSVAKQLMRSEVNYIHEEQTLDYALKVFLKTNHHLLVVVNTFEEFVGVISLEDVIEQILGRQIIDEFDEHADIRAVAKSLAEREAKQREKTQK